MPVGVDPVRRDETDLAILDQFQATPTELVHLDEPLVGEKGFDHLAGAVTTRHLELVWFGLDQQVECFEVGQYRLAGVVAILAAILRGRAVVDCGVGGEDVDRGEAMPLADRMVVEIVRRGDLDAAGAELALDVAVGDDRNLAIAQRQAQGLADQVGVAFVVGMDGDADVAEQGFRAGGGDHQTGSAVRAAQRGIGKGIQDRPQKTVFLFADHFQVGDGGLQHRIPVDQALAAIDQALLVQAHEAFDDGLGRHRVHGEHAARPVAGGAQSAHLAFDGVAGMLLPLPDLVDEGVATEPLAGELVGGEIACDDHFGGDAGVVGADLPEGVEATHAVVADQRVHQGVLEGMTHVQGAGDVRRWQQDAVGLALTTGCEGAVGFPLGVQAGLEFGGVVAFRERGHGVAVGI